MKNRYFLPTKSTLPIATFLLFFLLLTSCDDDDAITDQCFDNRTSEPIDLYIDGFYEFTIDEDDLECLFLGDGCFDWYVEGVLSGNFSEGTVCLGPGSFATTIVIDD